MQAKSPLLSRTVWVNLLTVAAAVLAHLSGATEYVPADSLPYIVGTLGIVNLALRFLTDKPIV